MTPKELEDYLESEDVRFDAQWQKGTIGNGESDFPPCDANSALWRMSETPLQPTTDQWKKSLHLQIAAHQATRAGMAYLSQSHSITPGPPPDVVTIDRDQFEAILGRLQVLESKVGVVPKNQPALSSTTRNEIACVTKELFGTNPTIEQVTDSNGDNIVHRVTVVVSDAEPEDVSTNRSRWHDIISELDIPKELSDNLRLKVVYQ